MASRQEFRRVDNIISTLKRMGNEANIFDVLDETISFDGRVFETIIEVPGW